MRRIFLAFCCFLAFASAPARAQDAASNGAATAPSATVALDAAQAFSNATPTELSAISGAFNRFDAAASLRDPNALKFFGVQEVAAKGTPLLVRAHLSHIAVVPSGALVRQRFQITRAASQDATPALTYASGYHDWWLERAANGIFRLASYWPQPDDAVTALLGAARQEWNVRPPRPAADAPTSDQAAIEAAAPQIQTTSSTQAGFARTPRSDVSANGDFGTHASGVIFDMIALRSGGRWVALRTSRWSGALLDPARLAARERVQAAQSETGDQGDGVNGLSEWLNAQMDRLEDNGPGTAHFFVQRGARGWVGLDAVWNGPHAQDSVNTADEQAAIQARATIEAQGFIDPLAHRDLGVALGRIGLYGEAADEWQKAELLRPGTIGAANLKAADAARTRDPRELAVAQAQSEANVGLSVEHPLNKIDQLKPYWDRQPDPSPLTALRLGLEYSKLAEDRKASYWLAQAEALLKTGRLKEASPSEQAWAGVLYEHLEERRSMAPFKPPNIIASDLFTLRCRFNDPDALRMLAALEAAQHTVYADFNIPMNSTEVVLWPSQSEFQKYTAKFSGAPTSEFVAALTLTKLISTEKGPVVLSEEVNAFYDSRADLFGTVAHEYGHVAVRQMSRGRTVPVWFNEGVATLVEGGYDGYLDRVRRARRSNVLLPMSEMREWNVDGERAFLAYSQANSILDYIVAKKGGKAVLDILRAIGGGATPDDAMRAVLGQGPDELWQSWAREGIK